MNLITKVLLMGLLITTPSHLNNADKNVTKLDTLAHYVRTHSNNNELVSYHIASALLHAGGDVKTLTAIARVESSFNPTICDDSGASIGMFQIQPKHHGVVPSNIYLQAKKAKEVLHTMKSIRAYNGSGKAAKRYEAKVLHYRKSVLI